MTIDLDNKCTLVLDLGSKTTKDIARILIRNRRDSGVACNFGRLNIYVASQDGNPGFNPESRSSYDTLVANNVNCTATDSWMYPSYMPVSHRCGFKLCIVLGKRIS